MKYLKRRHIAAVAALMIGCSMLTGCGSVIPEMTQEEEEAVGEFAAMTLLKYDANYRSRLVDLSLVEKKVTKELEAEERKKAEEEKKKESASTENKSGSGTTVVNNTETVQSAASIAEFLELPEGVSVTYSGMKVCDSYPDDTASFFTLDASSGKKLLVLNFDMTNNSSADQDINVLEKNPVCKVTVNESYTRTALVTMLTNDLSTYIGTVKAGASEQVVLLIEINESLESDVNSVSLTMKNTENTYTAALN